MKGKFVPHQRFKSNAAQSFKSFSINGKHYLAMANYGETEIAGDTGMDDKCELIVLARESLRILVVIELTNRLVTDC